MRGSELLACVFVVSMGCGDDAPPVSVWREAFPAEDLGWLLSVAGPTPDTLYAVGGQPGAGEARQWNGSNWQAVALPTGTPLLNWVHAFSADDVYAVGEEGTVVHFDGAEWVTETPTTTEDLWGVWGAQPDDVWAVGGRGVAEGQATLLRRQNGRWSRQPLPDLVRSGVFALYKVWGTSASDVFVVGQRGAILRFDGATWREEGAGVSQDLIAVWGSSPNEVVAVGGRGNGVAAVWDGNTWSSFELAPLPGLNGVWTDGPGKAWVVGEAGTVASMDTRTGGVSLAELPLAQSQRTFDFHAVFGDMSGRITAVGGNFIMTAGPYRGLAFWLDPETP